MKTTLDKNQESLIIDSGGFTVGLNLLYTKELVWKPMRLKQSAFEQGRVVLEALDLDMDLHFVLSESKSLDYLNYEIAFEADFDTQIKIQLTLESEKDLFHLIPANIFGDNNMEKANTGEYPILTDQYPEDDFCSPYWAFRADRAASPVSILCCDQGAVGISIDPYSINESGNTFSNGLFSQLPNQFGVLLGYMNDPVTFVNKRMFADKTWAVSKKSAAKGKIYCLQGAGRQMVHPMLRDIYYTYCERPVYHKTLKEAAQGLMDAFIHVNWSDTYQNYTNKNCKVPEDPTLKPWRQLPEIGWTAGGVMVYPFAVANYVLGLKSEYYGNRKNHKNLIDEIISGYNEPSGFINDVVLPNWRPGFPESPVNGWWSDFGLSKDCHCAYTNGSAVAYILKTYRFEKRYQNTDYDEWLAVCLKVLCTVIELQGTNGSYGYTYSTSEKKVLDWDGFAGCWFVEAMIYAYLETQEERFLISAQKAMMYYYSFVENLSCWGTPMDTWKSVDEEGNLAFIRGAKVLHEVTNDPLYLKMLEAGAHYEYIWKYAFKTHPIYPPLKNSPWNACGGSVTSVSNPHIHPMGMLVISELDYLAKVTGDAYHKDRADDSIAFMMNVLELYPTVTGYGQYGVLSERFCPSDGLLIETFSDGSPSSTWFSYNGWAGAAALEGIVERLLAKQPEIY